MGSMYKKLLSIIKYIPLCICLICIICYIILGKNFTIETILKYSPSNPYLAVCFLLFMHALKSLSIFFPLILLRIAAGHFFPVSISFLINIAGTLICHCIPYWIGYFSGSDFINNLKQKHPKLSVLTAKQHTNSFFICFFLRIINFLPGDIVSMYFGAIKIPFFNYLFAGILGSLPSIFLTTLMGTTISNPSSPIFIICALLMILLTVISVLAKYLHKTKSKKGKI